MLFEVVPVAEGVPVFMVRRKAGRRIYLVTPNKNQAHAAAVVYSESVMFRVNAYMKAGYHILAACTLDPTTVRTLHVAWKTPFEARLDKGWTAHIAQGDVDDMVELTVRDPSGVPQGRPVLFHDADEARAAAVAVYLRRFPQALTQHIFLLG